MDLGDYKAICLKKKTPVNLSRVSFGGATTADESIPDFPISIEKASKKKEAVKLDIKDVINELLEIGHGTAQSKKILNEIFKKEYSDLKKGHIEVFIKECFEKQKRPHDTKVIYISL